MLSVNKVILSESNNWIISFFFTFYSFLTPASCRKCGYNSFYYKLYKGNGSMVWINKLRKKKVKLLRVISCLNKWIFIKNWFCPKWRLNMSFASHWRLGFHDDVGGLPKESLVITVFMSCRIFITIVTLWERIWV